jgi:hypothetical protein
MMDDYITEHPKIKRSNRLRYESNQISGTLKDLIVLAYEARDDAGYTRFRIFVSEHGTPALEFYDGLIAPRIETEEQEQHSWLSKLRRKYGKA